MRYRHKFTPYINSFKTLTGSTRDALTELKATADKAGYDGVSEQLQTDIEQLNAMDEEIEKLLKKSRSRYLTSKEKMRLEELINTRDALEIKYHLTPADTGGFDTIAQKVEAEIARARAKGQDDADVSVYENALVATAEGMAAINAQLDAEYDKQYALIRLWPMAQKQNVWLKRTRRLCWTLNMLRTGFLPLVNMQKQ